MPAWKVFVVAAFGVTCLGLVGGTFMAPLTLTDEDGKWWWFGGLLVASIIMITLFVIFLRHADRTFKR